MVGLDDGGDLLGTVHLQLDLGEAAVERAEELPPLGRRHDPADVLAVGDTSRSRCTSIRSLDSIALSSPSRMSLGSPWTSSMKTMHGGACIVGSLLPPGPGGTIFSEKGSLGCRC